MRTIEITRDEAEQMVDLLEGNWGLYEPRRMDRRLIEVAAQIRHKFGMATREESAAVLAKMQCHKPHRPPQHYENNIPTS